MKKKILIILLIIITSITITGCNNKKQEKNIEYEDVYALTEEYNAVFKETTYYDNYKIDEKTGLILEYESYNLNKSGKKTNTHTFEIKYDENGNKIREVEDSSSSVITRTYQYEDNILTTFTYKSSKNNIEEITKYEYEYDNENRVTKEIEKEQKDDGDTITYTYEYYEDNKIKSKRYQNDDYYLIYEYTYNDEGNIKTETQESKNSFYKIEYEYDENGNKTKGKVYKNGSALVTYTHTYKYEKIGEKIKN